MVTLTCSLRSGLTMAMYRSTDSAASVNTDTPMDTSLANSLTAHMTPPHGHDSSVYTSEASGTQITITSRSALASEAMYLMDPVELHNTHEYKLDWKWLLY